MAEIKRFFIDSDILDEDLAKVAGGIRANYQLPFADAIVAATAIKMESILVTKNIKHFSKIKDLELKLNQEFQ